MQESAVGNAMIRLYLFSAALPPDSTLTPRWRGQEVKKGCYP